jgi:alpha-L-fucosidase
MKPILVFLTSILLCVSSPLFAEQQSEDEIAEEAANMAEKGAVNPSAAAIDVYRPATDISWFEDARFGMFVQWGISSDAAGIWQGKNYYGITEWLWRRSQASAAEYKALADTFNPTEFDAEEWVGLATDAGARYMVVAAKHHDGFALFDSDVSEFDIIDATPFARDPLAELAAEAKAQDMKLGFYYSQYQDWEHPDGGGNAWEYDPATQNFDRYQTEKAIPQLKELLSNYGDVALMWFDTPGKATKDEAKAFVDLVRDYQADTLISSRIGHGLGDYQNYRDSEIPVRHLSPKPWEAIFPHNESWAYSALDTDFKSTTELLHMLAHTASKGGNLLLNIGPDGKGNIPEGSVKRLRAVGEWLGENGESIYGTRAAPLGQLSWGVATLGENRLYLHVLHAPGNGKIFVPGIADATHDVRLLVANENLEWCKVNGGIEIQLPDLLPDSRNTVLTVSTDPLSDRHFESATMYFVDRQSDATKLSPELAELGGAVTRENLRYWLYFGQWKYFPTVGGLKSEDDFLRWNLNIIEPGEYKVSLLYSADATETGQEGQIVVDAGKSDPQFLPFRVLETGEMSVARPVPTVKHDIGIVEFAEGSATLSIAALQNGENLFKIATVILQPVD